MAMSGGVAQGFPGGGQQRFNAPPAYTPQMAKEFQIKQEYVYYCFI